MEFINDIITVKFSQNLILGVIVILGSLTLSTFLRRDQRKKNPKKNGILYYHSIFRSNRCIWLLREINALDDFELVDVDVWDKTSQKCKDFTERVNPHTTVPVLEFEDLIMVESAAICMYLADKYQKCLPDDKRDFYNIMFYACGTVDEVMEKLFVQYFFKEPKGEEDKNVIEQATQKFNICAKYLTSRLQSRQYICGDKFTVADCVIGYNIWWASVIKDGILLKNFPELQAYFCRLKNRPAFKQTWSNS